jgi:hypothetical protein
LGVQIESSLLQEAALNFNPSDNGNSKKLPLIQANFQNNGCARDKTNKKK